MHAVAQVCALTLYIGQEVSLEATESYVTFGDLLWSEGGPGLVCSMSL